MPRAKEDANDAEGGAHTVDPGPSKPSPPAAHSGSRFGVYGLGFGVWGLGFGVWVKGFVFRFGE